MYISLARSTAATYDRMWEKLAVDVKHARSPGNPARPLSQYVGCYYNRARNFFIEITGDANLCLLKMNRCLFRRS